jgi:hypothetical protein
VIYGFIPLSVYKYFQVHPFAILQPLIRLEVKSIPLTELFNSRDAPLHEIIHYIIEKGKKRQIILPW